VYFNVNFNVFFKLIKVHLLVSEFYIFAIYSQNHITIIQKRCQHSAVFLNAKVDSVYMHV